MIHDPKYDVPCVNGMTILSTRTTWSDPDDVRLNPISHSRSYDTEFMLIMEPDTVFRLTCADTINGICYGIREEHSKFVLWNGEKLEVIWNESFLYYGLYDKYLQKN